MATPVEIRVPDIGDFKDIPVIELLVKPGDVIAVEDCIATLESEKATLDVPSPTAGRVLTLAVTKGVRVSQGSLLLTVDAEPVSGPETAAARDSGTAAVDATPAANTSAPMLAPVDDPATNDQADVVRDSHRPLSALESSIIRPARVYASPSTRRIGRELGVNLAEVEGTGLRGRIVAEDVHRFVNVRLSGRVPEEGSSNELRLAPVQAIDFGKFGEIERRSLSRIRCISGSALQRNWSTIPHVTNFDEADITEIERFRQTINAEAPAARVTLVSFLVKACSATLKLMPTFNASLDGGDLILKKYVHIGVAVDTPSGLLVPVLHNVDKLGLRDIASTLEAKATSARDGKLKFADMQGGCFTVSSLGGVGGTGFTPIINAPELAILGAAKAKLEPRWDGERFISRLILPLSLSWDHRALDGVAAARFLVHLVTLMEDFRRALL